MSYRVICDHCNLAVYPAQARVVLPSAVVLPRASDHGDHHYHLDCWEKRKAEHSKPKV